MPTNPLARVAYREAGRATICEILYGPNVLKHAVIDPEAGDGEVATFSGMPLPIDCRPPAGRRRGEQVGVAPEKLIDAHGVFAYAGIASERVAPSARDPSESDWGTAVIASSESDEMKGMIMIPITSPAARALSEATSRPSSTPACRITGATISAAKNP